MIRIVQSIFLVTALILCQQSLAQNERISKHHRTQVADTTPVILAPNKTESVDKPSFEKVKKSEVLKSESIKKSPVNAMNVVEEKITEKKSEDAEEITQNQKTVLIDNSVTYEKVDEIASQKNLVSEKESMKPVKSVNYKPHVVREDIQNVEVQRTNSTGTISEFKKAYIKEEILFLEKEIEQFKNDPNYDLAGKQKKLEEIKKMIQ